MPRARVNQGRVGYPAYRPNYYGPGYPPAYRPYNRSYGYYRPGYPVGYQAYYTFRPRISLGFGLWVGYPVSYPYYAHPPAYAYSYPYAYSSSYPYPLGTTTYVYPAPSISATPQTPGGLSFEITPDDAEVYVDGQYFGTVVEFSPTDQPLWLTAGRHRIEIRGPGYEAVAFDVDIVPGQVIPYRGDLRRF